VRISVTVGVFVIVCFLRSGYYFLLILEEVVVVRVSAMGGLVDSCFLELHTTLFIGCELFVGIESSRTGTNI